MTDLHKIKDRSGLVKDPKSQGVINTDDEAFYRARAAKRRILEAQNRNEELEERVKKLESAIEQLLEAKQDG